MTRPGAAGAACVVAARDAAPAAGDAVEALRRRLAGDAARDHAVLRFLEDDLREARSAIEALAVYVSGLETALSDEVPSQERLLAAVRAPGSTGSVDALAAALASVRRRVAQVAARM